MKFDKLDRFDTFKWRHLQDATFEGKFDMPKLTPTNKLPHDLVAFHMAKSATSPNEKWFHFYEDDYQFERLWNRPERYMEILCRFEGGISPDFSLYLDMPKSQQIWNCWRNRVLAYAMQQHGIEIVPNVSWSDSTSLDWAFDGIPEHSVLSVTTQGCMREGVCKQSLVNGLHELIRAKSPTAICVYGKFPELWKDRFPVPIHTFCTFAEERWGT